MTYDESMSIFAFNLNFTGPSTVAALGAQFQRRRVHKYYVALTARKPSKKMGTVAGDMAKARRGAWKLTRHDAASAASASAVTRFISKGVTGAEPEKRPLRLLVFKPLTVGPKP
jgi:tRNA pseudouridine32 synthase/23S rRNA pseudouridine746 synthase